MVEIQTGLMLETTAKIINGKPLVFRKLYSKDGYCFYSKQQKAELDNWTGLEEDKPTLQYMRFASLGIHDDPSNYISVRIQDDFEIV